MTTVAELRAMLSDPDDDIQFKGKLDDLPVRFATGPGPFLELLSIYDTKDEKGNMIVCIDIG